jgi:hypothetical protein
VDYEKICIFDKHIQYNKKKLTKVVPTETLHNCHKQHKNRNAGKYQISNIQNIFRVDFSGRGELADRQQKLAQMLSRLQKISEGRK